MSTQGKVIKTLNLVECVGAPQAVVQKFSFNQTLLSSPKATTAAEALEERDSLGALALMLCTPVETSEMHLGCLPGNGT